MLQPWLRARKLRKACHEGDVDAVESLLKEGAYVNARSIVHGRTPLYLATKNNHIDAMTLLLEAKANPDIPTRWGRTPLHRAAEKGDFRVAKLLLDAKANPNRAWVRFLEPFGSDFDRSTAFFFSMAPLLWPLANLESTSPLYVASVRGHADIVNELIKANVDMNTRTRVTKESALQAACRLNKPAVAAALIQAGAEFDAGPLMYDNCSRGREEIVKILIPKAGVNCLHRNLSPLEVACFFGHHSIVQALLDANADVKHTVSGEEDLTSALGGTALHYACVSSSTTRSISEMIRALVRAGADVNALDSDRQTPLHWLLLSSSLAKKLPAIYILLTLGANADERCAHIIRNKKFPNKSELQACFNVWVEEQRQGKPLTKVPDEVLGHGKRAVMTYLAELKSSNPSTVKLRRKVCVIGPSTWGKTSFIKSMTSQIPSLADTDDRTVGIDLFLWNFVEKKILDGQSFIEMNHEISLWDFAGQREYHAAHALFFSPRTLYIVCIDAGAYSAILEQVDSADENIAKEELSCFVEYNITRWIRAVSARRPDAEFAFAITKVDLVGNDADIINRIKTDIISRLQEVVRVRISEIDRAIKQLRDGSNLALAKADDVNDRISHLDLLKSKSNNMVPKEWIMVSCIDAESVSVAKVDIQELIIRSDKSFAMPEIYSRVLDAILVLRPPPTAAPASRIESTFVNIDFLFQQLRETVPTLQFDDFRNIIRLLHDLGDVLWYEDLGSSTLSNTIILDPQLLLDVIRQVVNHNHTGEVMLHEKLSSLPLWSSLSEELMVSMKGLLQHFNLAYPIGCELQWDSDLIVPAYWGRADSTHISQDANHPPLALRGEPVNPSRVQWEYQIADHSPEAFFEHLAVASYSTVFARDVTPGCVNFQADEKSACRISVNHMKHTADGGFVIRVECLVANRSDIASWDIFRHACMAMEEVLVAYPGLVIRRRVIDDRGQAHSIEAVVRDLVKISKGSKEESVNPTAKWLPPDLTWYHMKAWLPRPCSWPDADQADMSKIDVVIEMLKGGSRADYPTFWTLEYISTPKRKLELKILSDVSGKCWHPPIELKVPPKLFAKHGFKIQVGISLFATAVAAVPAAGGFLQGLVGLASARVDGKVDEAEKVHTLIANAGLHANERLEATRNRKFLPDEATALLVDLLQTYDKSFNKLRISGLCKLERCVTTNGRYMWAHRSEIQGSQGKMMVCRDYADTRSNSTLS